LSEEKRPMPKWQIVRHPQNIPSAAKRIGFPLVLKTAFGTWGKGVFYAENLKTLQPIADYLAIRDKNPVILEEFIEEAKCNDLRVFTIGDRVIASMKRKAKKNDIRANIGIGGSGKKIKITKKEEELTLRVVRLFDLEMAGVDILRSSRGPIIIEVNSNPGLEGITEVTGIDVAGEIIKHVENKFS
jgi:ribosomal protein S6--L-glutamate ligase